MPELVHEGHPEPEHSPHRPDGDGHERPREHDEQRPATEEHRVRRLQPLPEGTEVHDRDRSERTCGPVHR
ncbi:hypothetical protein GCM10012283_29610 [Phycicoccus endophyticus]|nr:hypothetical protein GCM10012283_29610 [Phycicoccus endophyticus]